MLSESQIQNVWESQIGAEVRALYFAELAGTYTLQKQWITGLSFFLSSGAAITLFTTLPTSIPIACSVLVALLTAYSIARNLDSAIRTMAKLHYSWSQVASDYESLWNTTYAEDAGLNYDRLVSRERDLSELASTDAPNNQKRLGYWMDQVLRQHHLSNA